MSENIIYNDARMICDAVDLSVLEDKTVLIAGASGLIGTYLLACLRYMNDIGKQIRVMPIIHSEPEKYSIELADHANIQLLKIDLSDYRRYDDIPQADYIIHAAGYAQPAIFMAHPITAIQLNTSATIALFNKLKPNGKLLFVSTSELYSGLEKTMYSESDIGTTTPSHPRSSYIEGKRCGEAICHNFLKSGKQAAIARVALAYGPGTKKDDTRVLNSFIRKAIVDKKIEMLDAGDALRTYCYVADTAEILWRVLLEGNNDVYNVGGVSNITIADLARKIGDLTNTDVIFPQKNNDVAGAPKDVRLDLSKLTNEFAKNQFISLDEGLVKTIEWQRNTHYENE